MHYTIKDPSAMSKKDVRKIIKRYSKCVWLFHKTSSGAAQQYTLGRKDENGEFDISFIDTDGNKTNILRCGEYTNLNHIVTAIERFENGLEIA